MTTETAKAELQSILQAACEQIHYFEELGVELIEPSNLPVVQQQPVATPTKREPVPASAAARNPLPLTKPPAVALRPPTQSPSVSVPTSALFEYLTKAPEKRTQSSETFEDIHHEIGNCTLCELCERRTNVVHTEGNRQARLMFIGEAPGADEDAQSRPFVGRAGQLLTKIIEAIGLKREEVLIGNVNRCRPPGNRPPTAEEAAICKPFLLREIASAQPEVIVVLGNTAMRNLLDVKEGITRLRGNFLDYKGIKVMPTFHPAYLLRDPSKKRETWEDLKKVRAHLDNTDKLNRD